MESIDYTIAGALAVLLPALLVITGFSNASKGIRVVGVELWTTFKLWACLAAISVWSLAIVKLIL